MHCKYLDKACNKGKNLDILTTPRAFVKDSDTKKAPIDSSAIKGGIEMDNCVENKAKTNTVNGDVWLVTTRPR